MFSPLGSLLGFTAIAHKPFFDAEQRSVEFMLRVLFLVFFYSHLSLYILSLKLVAIINDIAHVVEQTDFTCLVTTGSFQRPVTAYV